MRKKYYIGFVKVYLNETYSRGFIKLTTKRQNILNAILNRAFYEENFSKDYSDYKKRDDKFIGSMINPYVENRLRDTYLNPSVRWEKIKVRLRKPKGKGISSRQNFH